MVKTVNCLTFANSGLILAAMSKISLQKAVSIAGGQVHLAALIRALVPGSKIQQPHISGWLNAVKAEVPPAEAVLAISEACEWKITPHELRPDIYPSPADGLPARRDDQTKEAA